MSENEFLRNYYENYDEDGRLRSKHGLVEFKTTMRYIEKYLAPDARILEIGAGTGRYSHALAQRGYAVDAVELIEHNIDIFRRNTKPGEKITVRRGNALELAEFADDTYDITLLLGPMYHLYTEEDQRRALQEALRVTKPGGVIFVAYLNNDATIVGFAFLRQGIRDPHFGSLIDRDTFRAHSNPEDIFQMYRREDVDALMNGLPVQRLHYVGTDMLTNFFREQVDSWDDELFELWVQYCFSICERADMIGFSHHTLDVFRKS